MEILLGLIFIQGLIVVGPFIGWIRDNPTTNFLCALGMVGVIIVSLCLTFLIHYMIGV